MCHYYHECSFCAGWFYDKQNIWLFNHVNDVYVQFHTQIIGNNIHILTSAQNKYKQSNQFNFGTLHERNIIIITFTIGRIKKQHVNNIMYASWN